MIEFELEGRAFSVQRLKLEAACAGLECLAKALGPMMAAAEGPSIQGLLAGAGYVPALLKVFAPVAKVRRGPNGEFERVPDAPWVALSAFQDDVFAGRLDLAIAFLWKAAENEYGYFLGANGGALAALMPKP